MKIIDISRPLYNETPVWPGDTPFSFSLNWTKEETGSVNVGQLTMSSHTGTHVDAPFHFDSDGKRILDMPLERFMGPAIVVSVEDIPEIGPEHVMKVDFTSVKKVLFKTGAWKEPARFPEHIPPINKELAPFLKEKGIDLIGVDLPSVDPLDSKDLKAHHSLRECDIGILEGIDLSHVDPGVYELVALPLPLKEGDGSPVRAVLIDRK
ncbi:MULTISPECIES: arylformamidase [Bacillaceae]|uniref:arylformamidase n=1 Tax=Bacillaceae TaxID=186817 RepID=UPI001C58289C|nr:arylformamidase [Rossellomorea sp. YZS02]MBW3112852.1 arylformamidase [Bacillus sp. MCCB 382]MDX8342832.1 arylformamidase [Rossellomorea sp. YZS02]